MDTHIWPSFVRNMEWPKDGITYSYEHRGYIRPEKVELWLQKAFGDENARFVLFNERIYIKAPRKPTQDERRWMEDTSSKTGVQVAECGWLSLDGSKPATTTSNTRDVENPATAQTK